MFKPPEYLADDFLGCPSQDTVLLTPHRTPHAAKEPGNVVF